MLVFSARLPIKQTVTRTEFLSHVFRWVSDNTKVNSGISPDELAVYDVESHENFKVANNLSQFEIRNYNGEEMQVCACRLTQSEARVIQSYDLIMAAEDGQKSLMLQIHKQFNTEGHLTPRYEQTRPDDKLNWFILKILGKLTDVDDGIPTSWLPLAITSMETREICAQVIQGKRKNLIPVVYVSKPFNDVTHVEVERLAKKWQGLVHVVYETESDTSAIMREKCNGQNVFNGNVALYFSGTPYNRHYNINNYTGNYEAMYKKIFAEMCAFGVHMHSGLEYSWDKLNMLQTRQEIEKLLSDSTLQSMRATEEELREQMKELTQKLHGYIRLLDEQKRKYENEKIAMQIAHEEELKNQQREFEQELQTSYRSYKEYTQSKNASDGFFKLGAEHELCAGEASDLLYSILKQVKAAFPETSHPYALIGSMLAANSFKGEMSKILKETEQLVKCAHNLTKSELAKLEKLGYTLIEGEHYKLKLAGDARYQFSISKTPSDKTCSGENLMSEIRGNLDVERKIR